MVVEHRVILPAQSEIQGQARSDFPVILCVEGVGLGVAVTVRLVYRVELGLIGDAEQECAERIADQRGCHSIVERVHAKPLGRVHVGAEAPHVTEIAAESHRVPALVPGQVIENLEGILPRNSRRVSAGLLEAGDGEVRDRTAVRVWLRQSGQAKLARDLAGGDSEGGGCVHPVVPAADFIHECRRDHVIVSDGQSEIDFRQGKRT